MEATQARQAGRKTPTRRRRKRVSLSIFIIVCALVAASSFALGWVLGVQSTRYTGNILLVNQEHPLPPDYVPEDLVNLFTQRHSFRLANSNIQLSRTCYEPMEQMFAAAERENMNGFTITSGYRSYDRQAEIFAQSESGKAQPAGCSEHQTGLAFDVTVETSIGFENTPQYAWLQAHAHEYGFIQRYPPNMAHETGISYEPWHYRYVGKEAASKIHARGITLETFMAN